MKMDYELKFFCCITLKGFCDTVAINTFRADSF